MAENMIEAARRALREAIVADRQEGMTMLQIAVRRSVSISTVAAALKAAGGNRQTTQTHAAEGIDAAAANHIVSHPVAESAR